MFSIPLIHIHPFFDRICLCVCTLYCIPEFTIALRILQVSVVDAGGVGDVLETFPISSDPISCIASVPGFDDQDPEVLASK